MKLARPQARTRGGPAAMTIGYLGVGATVALILVVGGSLLSTHQDSGLVFTVYVANIFGLGVATPTELLITRRYNIGAARAVRRPRQILAATAGVTAVVVWLVAALAGAYHGSPAVGPCSALAVVAWAALVGARSRLSGVGDLHAYAIVLVVESCVRVGLLGAAVLWRSAAEVLLCSSAGLPLLVSAAGAMCFHVAPEVRKQVAGDLAGSEQLSFIIVLLGYQGCLNMAPVLLAARTGTAAFGNANAYFRAPLVLVGGIYTHGLVAMSRAWGARDLAAFRAALRGAIKQTLIWVPAVTAAASIAAPIALRVLYPPAHLPFAVYASLAGSGVLAGVASVAGVALQAAGHARRAAVAWLAAASVTIGAFAVSNGTDALASAGLLLGPLLALVWVGLSVRRLLHHAGLTMGPTPSVLDGADVS